MGACESCEEVPRGLVTPASVKLAASVLFHIPTASRLRGGEPKDGYHTSILVEDVEYLFDDAGVERVRYSADKLPISHSVLESETKIIDMGTTTTDPLHMVKALRHIFEPGTYDLIRKNCNSFCDCALFYLLDVRLDPRYRELERIAKWGQKNFGLMSALNFTGLRYQENPRAADFKVDEAVRRLAQLRGVPYVSRDGAEEPAQAAPQAPPAAERSSSGGAREYCCLGRAENRQTPSDEWAAQEREKHLEFLERNGPSVPAQTEKQAVLDLVDGLPYGQ